METYAGLYSSSLQLSILKVEAVGFCEMLYQATRCHVLEDGNHFIVICSALSGPAARASRDNFPISTRRLSVPVSPRASLFTQFDENLFRTFFCSSFAVSFLLIPFRLPLSFLTIRFPRDLVSRYRNFTTKLNFRYPLIKLLPPTPSPTLTVP